MHAPRASLLVDGANYYAALRNSMLKAERSIYIVGWDIDSRVRLAGDEPPDDGAPERLRDFLTYLARERPDLRVHVLLWDFSILYVDVIRPADPEETAGAFVAALARTDGPTSLVLSRQGVPNLSSIPVQERRQGALKGAYIARKEEGDLSLIILSNGAELQHALKAAEQLGSSVRVVSMPCFERFERQGEEYRESIIPAACRKRIAIEAGVSDLWHKYVGLDGKVIGIDRFGLSADGGLVLKELGISAEDVISAAESL